MSIVGQSFLFYPNSDLSETMAHSGKIVRVTELLDPMDDDDQWVFVECIADGWRGEALVSELVVIA